MKENHDPDPVRIPVKLVDRRCEYFYGGELPIKNGSTGDLIVDKSAIEDPVFLDALKRPSKHKILEAGTVLLVALTIKNVELLAENLKKELQSRGEPGPSLGAACFFKPRSAYTQFISITIGDPTQRQKQLKPTEDGGVWLHMEGLQPKGVSSSTVILPDIVSKKPADSLNHAFTLLSEKYEPWRKSHTGNIYNRMLYQETDDKWYPLDILRKAAIAKDELGLIREQWDKICQKLNIKPAAG